MLEKVRITEKKNYTKGNANYMVQVESYSTITNLGSFHINTKNVKLITFDQIKETKGLVKIEGYLIYEFTQRARNEPNNWISSITDGTRKLDVILIKDSSDKINWGRGTKLKIIGDLVEIDSTYLLTVSNPCNITTLDEKPMGLNALLNGCTLIYKETI
uniref:Uncharacterized protein n=1 Tax=Trichogramma kaykai TaxID=54128 RepID=A0ABD2XAB0_9HYME